MLAHLTLHVPTRQLHKFTPTRKNAILTRSNNPRINPHTLSDETGSFPATGSLSTDFVRLGRQLELHTTQTNLGVGNR